MARFGLPHHSSMPYEHAITREMVESAQEEWEQGILNIQQAWRDELDYVQVARDFLTDLYAYNHSDVLFTGIWTSHTLYRPTFEGALSYLVGTNGTGPHSQEDGGMAIVPDWTMLNHENENIIVSGKTAVAMGTMRGSYTRDGIQVIDAVLSVFSFAYMLDDEGQVRITMHNMR